MAPSIGVDCLYLVICVACPYPHDRWVCRYYSFINWKYIHDYEFCVNFLTILIKWGIRLCHATQSFEQSQFPNWFMHIIMPFPVSLVLWGHLWNFPYSSATPSSRRPERIKSTEGARSIRPLFLLLPLDRTSSLRHRSRPPPEDAAIRRPLGRRLDEDPPTPPPPRTGRRAQAREGECDLL